MRHAVHAALEVYRVEKSIKYSKYKKTHSRYRILIWVNSVSFCMFHFIYQNELHVFNVKYRKQQMRDRMKCEVVNSFEKE